METFGKYQILRRLGAGGMAEVFLAREPLAGGLSKTLVLKKIHPGLAETPQFRAMFEDEAKIGVVLNHPNIVQTFTYGQIGRTYFLAMERVEGIDLLRLIHASAHARKKIPPGLAAYIVQQMAKGLDYAHRKSDDYGEPLHIVHRDVSPQNVLVSFDGAVKIVDFGIARVRGQKNDDGVVKGKYAYMSPEQAAGLPVDRRSDIFSSGIVLYEVATQLALFGRLSERQAVDAIRNAQVPRPRESDPEMPEELEAIILKCLQRRPEERFQTARDLHNALGRFFFQLGSAENTLYESGTMAAFIAQVVPAEERARIRSLELPGPLPPLRTGGGASLPSRTEVEPAPAEVQAAGPASATTAVTDGGAALPLVTGLRERKAVVVVDGVLEGLAALRRQVGEPRARTALLDFLRVAEHVAYKHHAHPERLDDRGFRYVLGLPVASEHDAQAGVHLALALIDALDGIARDLRPPLKLAIGVERGAAIVARSVAEGDSRFEHELVGEVGGIARRLAEEAMAAEVLVGPEVFRALRDDWVLEEIEPLQLGPPGTPTGRARVHRVRAARGRAERNVVTPGGVLWGRELELQALDDAARDVVARGAGRWLLLVGERGVGKRSLVSAFCARLDPATHRVLRAVASPTRRDVPYGLMADLARDLLSVPDEDDPRELKRKIEAAVHSAFFEGGDELPPDEASRPRTVADAMALLFGLKIPGGDEIDPSERRHRLYHGIRWLGDRLARQRTLVILVEDLHWADAQSFEVLTQLARDPFTRPVLMVATARHERRPADLSRGSAQGGEGSDDDARLEPLIAEPQVTTIYVGELEPRAREALVNARFEHPEDPEVQTLVRAVLDRTGGNPFYIQEILETLAERGIVEQPAGAPRYLLVQRDVEVELPLSVEAVVASRLDRLPDDERAVLRAAAVLGRTFRGADLLALAGDSAAPSLERLLQRGLLATATTGSELTFRSAVAQEVMYGSLADEVKSDLHRRAASRLAAAPAYRVGADDARIAQHLEAAGDTLGAARAFARAGQHARDVSGNAEAFRHFTNALRRVPPGEATREERWELHAEREPILRAWGKRAPQLREISAMRRLAEEMNDRRRLARSLARHGLLYLDTGRHAAARREIGRALEMARAAGDPITEAEALRLDATLLMNIGSYDEALDRIRAGLAALGEQQERAALIQRGQILHALGNIHLDRGHGREAERAYAEALVIYRRLGIRRLESATLNNLGNVSNALGEYEEAIDHYKHSLKIDQEIGDRVGVGATLGNVGQTYALLGDLDRARRYLAKAILLDESHGDQPGLTDATIGLGQVFLRLGDAGPAAEQLERGLELAQQGRNRYQEIRALIYLAFCKLEATREPPEAALDLARSAVKLAREANIANGLAFGLCAQALALGRAGRLDDAVAHAAEAVGIIDGGRSIDEVEEILHVHARLAAEAGRAAEARASLGRALGEVRAKAERLRDESWRRMYLASKPASTIVADAERSGLA